LNRKFAVPVLFISSIGWGLSWLPIKSLTQSGLDGIHLVLIAFTSAGLLLLPALWIQRSHWQSRLHLLFAIAVFGGFANLAFQIAMVHGNVVRVMILFYLLPVWSVLGGWYFLQERPDRLRIFAMILSLMGAAMILNVDSTTFAGLNTIDLLAIGSGFALAMNNILFRKTAEQPLAGKVSAMFIGCALLIGSYVLMTPTTASLPDNMTPFYAILYGVMFLSLITFGTQWGVTQLEAGRASLIIVMELVAAVVSVAIFTELSLTFREVVGAIMVLTAAILEGWRDPEPVKESIA
jgi:drug/metabolite transporter (DMT)-like permease